MELLVGHPGKALNGLTLIRYTYAILVAAEISAASVVIQYWIPNEKVNVAVWITVLLIVLVALNIFVVSIFGEAEFWFAGYVASGWSASVNIFQNQAAYYHGVDACRYVMFTSKRIILTRNRHCHILWWCSKPYTAWILLLAKPWRFHILSRRGSYW